MLLSFVSLLLATSCMTLFVEFMSCEEHFQGTTKAADFDGIAGLCSIKYITDVSLVPKLL